MLTPERLALATEMRASPRAFAVMAMSRSATCALHAPISGRPGSAQWRRALSAPAG